jgi:hypothetical protein
VWAHSLLWPVDLVVQRFYSGQFAQAEEALSHLPETLPAGGAEFIAELREELQVARALYPQGGDWRQIREDLGNRALARGREELASSGPAAARPWMAVGMAKRYPSPEALSLYLYCQAVVEADVPRADELRRHLLDEFELGAALRSALRGL